MRGGLKALGIFCLGMIPALTLPAQKFQWVKQIEGTSEEAPTQISTDPDGNIYILGDFNNSADLDPGPGTANLISNGSTDVFLAKYSSGGNFLWAFNIGSSLKDRSFALANDDTGNIYITGSFRNSVDFDPGTGNVTLTSNGNQDIFFAKYDSSVQYIWAKSIGGASYEQSTLAIDDSGYVYLSGFFNSAQMDFNPGTGNAVLSNKGSYDIFLASYGNNGKFQWAKSMGGKKNNSTDKGNGIEIDPEGNILITGYFQSTVDFDPGSGIAQLSTNGKKDIFFAKYARNGKYLWAKSIGSSKQDQGKWVTADTAGNIFITGMYQGNADFDPDTGSSLLTNRGSNDIFLAKYDKNGNYLWAKSTGSISNDRGINLEIDSSINLYLCGSFKDTADFDPGPGKTLLISTGSSDGFFTKYYPYDPCKGFHAGFKFRNTCEGKALTFTDTSAIRYGKIISYHWDPGNGDSSNNSNPSFTY